MTTPKRIGLAAVIALMAMAQAGAAEIYIREGNQKIDVSEKGGKLFCTRISDGYEMCNGMVKSDDGTWKGKRMKHPDMPRWMSFNGTVAMQTDGLSIKGCALGICDSETWSKP